MADKKPEVKKDSGPRFLERFAEKAIILVCFGLGGWWLQNQNNTLQRVAAIQVENLRHVGRTYVDKDFARSVDASNISRLDYIERKIEKLEDRLAATSGKLPSKFPPPHTHDRKGL